MRVDLLAALTTVALSVSPPPTQPPAPPGGVQGKPFTYTYPFALPEGGGGVSGVAINSRGHLFAFSASSCGWPRASTPATM